MNDELYELWSLNEGWQIYKIVEPVILIGVGISSLNTKLFSVWIHKLQNKIHYMNNELYELSLNEGWQICKIAEPVISAGIDTGSLDKYYFRFEYIKYKIKFII